VKRLNRSLLAVTVAFVSIAELASNASASRTTLSATSTPLPSSVEVILKGVHQVSKPAGAPLIDKSGETTYVDLDRTAYIVTASPNVAFTSVKTYFTVPSITGCMGGAEDLASLDGVNSPDFEQAGVFEYGCNGVTTAVMMYNVANYGAYYFGPVNPGDAIMAMVSVNSSQQYLMQVKDLTTGAEIAVTQGCEYSSCPDGTAEVDVEPENINGDNLADFTTVNFTGISITANAANARHPIRGSLASKHGYWSSSVSYDIRNGKPLTDVSRLHGGRAFTVTWESYY